MKKLVLTVGNGMMGDDAAGPLLANKIKQTPLKNWAALNGGSTPENYLHQIREMAPRQVLVVDSADMDLPPGEIRLISDEKMEDPFLMTTHTLPLSYLIHSIREFVPSVDLVGVQPKVIAFGYPISENVKMAVDQIYDQLKRDSWSWQSL
jgi:hydrogenase 3 maturation protease